MNSAKPQICFLLALWGKSYIRMFCDMSLRSLLARGNIPALAEEYACTFTLLTRDEDIKLFESQPIFPLLKRYCKIRYVDIHDLVFPYNHSATLTVALERGMRSQGDAMLDTYFIFLVADYLFAQRALSGLLPYLRKGVSAITAGNYQVVEEEVLEDIKGFIDPADGTIGVPNRELVAWSLRHLHPMTVANTVNTLETCTLHTNRLFWRVDDATVIGRFYLRHMLCIKPEVTDYVIGSSCDYSFIEEMCPSGNVAHIADSDEYFIVELQPLLHEGKFLSIGAHSPEALAISLSEWTTREQRANAHVSVVFHAKDNPEAVAVMREESRRYIERIEAAMLPEPMPVRGHFYWFSCIQWITANLALAPDECLERASRLNSNVWESPVFSPPLKAAGLSIDMFPPMRDEDVADNVRRVVQFFRLYVAVFGAMPGVYLWHPHFLDYQLLKQALSPYPEGRVLFILPPKRRQWMEWSGHPRITLRSPLIAYRDPLALREELKDFSACVIHLPEEYDRMTGALFDRLLLTMPRGSDIHIFIKSPIFSSRSYSPRHRALRYEHFGQKPGVRLAARRAYTGAVRKRLDKWLSAAATRMLNKRHRPLTLAWCGAQVALLHACYLVHNALSRTLPPLRSRLDNKSVCSAILTFRVEP